MARNALCAGTGGSNGGYGGQGAPYTDLKCALNSTQLISDANKSGQSGESGIFNADLGGKGGGIIWLSSLT